MNMNDVYGDSKWLKAADLKGKKVKVRIEDWDVTEFAQQDGSKRKQTVVSFAGASKRFGLNKTNAELIASMYGADDFDKWIGKEITLYPTKTRNMTGQLVDCIRVEYVHPENSGFVSGLPQNGNGHSEPVKPKLKKIADELNPPDDLNDECPF